MIMLGFILAFEGYKRNLWIFLAGDFDAFKIHVARMRPKFPSWQLWFRAHFPIVGRLLDQSFEWRGSKATD